MSVRNSTARVGNGGSDFSNVTEFSKKKESKRYFNVKEVSGAMSA